VQVFWHLLISLEPVLNSLLRLGLQSGLFPSGFPTADFYAFLAYFMRAIWSALLMLLYFVILITCGEEKKV
jgi:hypothetical protein